ncbi:MAG: hypothetical protein IJU01_00475 [Lachnospiraceae bacterium]|nr:hypothetical protein [Lachnospiraceae bacterium]
MSLIKGITVQLLTRTASGRDGFNRQTYSEVWEDVTNVLVGSPTETELIDAQNLTGGRAVYVLHIPKGDTHTWENTKVRFYGETWRTIGKPIKYIDELTPLQWNMKVRVESEAADERQG